MINLSCVISQLVKSQRLLVVRHLWLTFFSVKNSSQLFIINYFQVIFQLIVMFSLTYLLHLNKTIRKGIEKLDLEVKLIVERNVLALETFLPTS